MYQNIVALCVDSLRFDGVAYNQKRYLGYSHSGVYTPNLDKLAQEGTSIENVYSSNSFTTAAHASLFTGVYPLKHGIRGFFDFKQVLNPNIQTLAEKYNEEGYATIFFSDIKELFSEMNIWRGFRYKTYGKISWLWNTVESIDNKNKLIFIHLFDVHEPYLFDKDGQAPPAANQDYFQAIGVLRQRLQLKSKVDCQKQAYAAWREIKETINEKGLSEREYLKPLYFRGVEKFDREKLPIIIKQLGRMGINNKNTLLVILADHGEGAVKIGDKNHFHHSGELSEEVIRIPLLLNKKIKTGSSFPLSMIDVFQIIRLGDDNKIDEYIGTLIKSRRASYAEYIEIDKRGFKLVDNEKQRLVREIKRTKLNKKMLQRVVITPNYKLVIRSNSNRIKSPPEQAVYSIYKREYPFAKEAGSLSGFKELVMSKYPGSEGAVLRKANLVKTFL